MNLFIQKMKTYYINVNGGIPFAVTVGTSMVKIYSNEGYQDFPMKDNEYEVVKMSKNGPVSKIRKVKEPVIPRGTLYKDMFKFKFLMRINHKKVFVPKGYMTKEVYPQNLCARGEEQIGGLLIQQSPQMYVYVGRDVIRFRSREQVKKVLYNGISSGVAYNYAITDNTSILLLEDAVIERIKEDDPYWVYYHEENTALKDLSSTSLICD